MKINQKKENGYTIIETMISVSLFLVVVMSGTGALLNSSLLQQKSADMRSIMDNMNFIMEEASRDLRTGYDYHCITDGNVAAVTPLSCAFGQGVSFKSAFGEQLVYMIYPDGTLRKSTNGGASFIVLTPPEVTINPVSGFLVLGAEPPPNPDQPLVKIRLDGSITTKSVITPFSLQTSVSQRIIDII